MKVTAAVKMTLMPKPHLVKVIIPLAKGHLDFYIRKAKVKFVLFLFCLFIFFALFIPLLLRQLKFYSKEFTEFSVIYINTSIKKGTIEMNNCSKLTVKFFMVLIY